MKKEINRTCPVWVGYLLASPIRKIWQNPEKMLKPYIQKGMNVLDIGSAMGFFSIPMAKMTGETGKVVCVDVQPKMLENLAQRAEKAGVKNLEYRVSNKDSLCIESLKNSIDFALASAVIHEISHPEKALNEIGTAIKKNGKFYIAEPKGHVSEKLFEETVQLVVSLGFTCEQRSVDKMARIAVFNKN